MKDDVSFSPVAVANEFYEAKKAAMGFKTSFSIASAEKWLKLAPGQLSNWRANNLSRKGHLRRNGCRPGNTP